jgi:uncharacterized protein (DUF169 family)
MDHRTVASQWKQAGLHDFDPAEVAHGPGIRKPHQVVVYRPLAEFPLQPDLILFMLDPYQAMLASEALGRVSWSGTAPLGTFGRPACAALPKAEQIGAPTSSLGCIGARTYTGLPRSEMSLVVPRKAFEQASGSLAAVADANCEPEEFHAGPRRSIAALG